MAHSYTALLLRFVHSCSNINGNLLDDTKVNLSAVNGDRAMKAAFVSVAN